jgi:hypothetical protein
MYNYIEKRNNIYYFRKKIKRNLLYRKSFIKIFGKKTYYQILANNCLVNISNLINNQLEYLLSYNKGVTMQDIDLFIQELLERYKLKAVINENGNYTQSIGTDITDIEEKRFSALDTYDELGTKFKGHTPYALNKELTELNDAYDTGDIGLLHKKANQILDRQNIILSDEVAQIPEDRRFQFNEALVKSEMIVLDQDLRNYNALTPNQNNQQNKYDIPDEMFDMLSEMMEDKKRREQKIDDWDTIINNHCNTFRKEIADTKRIDLIQFKMIMQGDENFGYPTYQINDIQTDADIEKIKQHYLDLPALIFQELKSMWREKGIIYTIDHAKSKREKYKNNPEMFKKYAKNKLGGLQAMIKTILIFLKYLKRNYKSMYKDLDFEVWDRLQIEKTDLSIEDLQYNYDSKKIPLYSEDLNDFLLYMYPQNPTNKVESAQIKKNWSVHTSNKQGHIFWSIILGIFTGARAQELAQIRLSKDLHKVENNGNEIYYFYLHVSDIKNQSHKNLNAERIVPICDKLIEIGFLNFVEDRLRLKKEWLFDLNPNSSGKRKEFPRKFNDLFKEFYQSKHGDVLGQVPTYHSLRAHFISKFLKRKHILSEDDIDDNNTYKQDTTQDLISLKKMVGHTSEKIDGDITLETYDREPLSLFHAKMQINEIKFHIDEGYEFLKQKMIDKYGTIKTSIKI